MLERYYTASKIDFGKNLSKLSHKSREVCGAVRMGLIVSKEIINFPNYTS